MGMKLITVDMVHTVDTVDTVHMMHMVHMVDKVDTVDTVVKMVKVDTEDMVTAEMVDSLAVDPLENIKIVCKHMLLMIM